MLLYLRVVNISSVFAAGKIIEWYYNLLQKDFLNEKNIVFITIIFDNIILIIMFDTYLVLHLNL